MKFLLDQNVYYKTALFLKNLGHDVVRVAEIGLESAPDGELLEKAREFDRIFVTRDKDFGNLVFLKGIKTGVILLRLNPSDLEQVHRMLEKALKSLSEEEIKASFLVIDHNKYRVRKLNFP